MGTKENTNELFKKIELTHNTKVIAYGKCNKCIFCKSGEVEIDELLNVTFSNEKINN